MVGNDGVNNLWNNMFNVDWNAPDKTDMNYGPSMGSFTSKATLQCLMIT